MNAHSASSVPQTTPSRHRPVHFKIVGLIAVVLLLVILAGDTAVEHPSHSVASPSQLQIAPSHSPSPALPIHNPVLSPSVRDVPGWWLPTSHLDDRQNLNPALANRLLAISDYITQTLPRYRQASPLAAEVLDAFQGKIYFSVVTNGVSAALLQRDHPLLNGADPTQWQEICFVPADAYAQDPYPSAAYFNQQWGAVMLAGVDMPDLLRDAMLLHELGHALRARQGAASSTASQFSELYNQEEMDMHQMEHDVLNWGTKGFYGEAITVLAAGMPVQRPQLVPSLMSLTPADCQPIYDLLGLPVDNPWLAAPLNAQIFISVGIMSLPPNQMNASGSTHGHAAFYGQLIQAELAERP